MVAGQVGKGSVVLSSVHPEFGGDVVSALPDLEGKRSEWSTADEELRQQLWGVLLHNAGIESEGL